jgi:hypothetical protein
MDTRVGWIDDRLIVANERLRSLRREADEERLARGISRTPTSLRLRLRLGEVLVRVGSAMARETPDCEPAGRANP